jgi:transposase-like protein
MTAQNKCQIFRQALICSSPLNLSYQAWRWQKLGEERWVYLWTDGIYSGLRAEDEQRCTLVLIEVNERGKKRLLALALLGLAVEGTARNSADLLR